MTKQTLKQLADKKHESFKIAEKKEQLTDWLLEQGFEQEDNKTGFKLNTKLQVKLKVSIKDDNFVLNVSYRQAVSQWNQEEEVKFFYAAYPDIKVAFKEIRKICKEGISNAQV